MISPYLILLLLSFHFVADFVLQNDWMATNKSKDFVALGWHVGLYTVCFWIFGWQFAIVNGCLHFLTDMITSRITAYLWAKERRHDFFVTIGFDQLIHATCL